MAARWPYDLLEPHFVLSLAEQCRDAVTVHVKKDKMDSMHVKNDKMDSTQVP